MANIFPGRLVDSVNGQIGEVQVTEDKNYVYEQVSATNNWTINHGLNKQPSVDLVDVNGNVVKAKITYVNLNQVTITFNQPFIGKAIFN